MKTEHAGTRWLNALFFLAMIPVIQGCYSYQSILKSKNSQAERQTEMAQRLKPGQAYLILLRNGAELNIHHVISVTDHEIIGEMVAKDAQGVMLLDKDYNVATSPNGRISLADIADIREKKFSTSRTVLVVAIPIVLVGGMAVATKSNNDSAGNP